MSGIGMIVGIVFSVIVVFALVPTFESEVASMSRNGSYDYGNIEGIMSVMFVIPIIAVMISAVWWLSEDVEQVTFDDDYEVVHTVSRAEAIKLRKDAIAVLRMRYAKGEISSMEFSERMARL